MKKKNQGLDNNQKTFQLLSLALKSEKKKKSKILKVFVHFQQTELTEHKELLHRKNKLGKKRKWLVMRDYNGP